VYLCVCVRVSVWGVGAGRRRVQRARGKKKKKRESERVKEEGEKEKEDTDTDNRHNTHTDHQVRRESQFCRAYRPSHHKTESNQDRTEPRRYRSLERLRHAQVTFVRALD